MHCQLLEARHILTWIHEIDWANFWFPIITKGISSQSGLKKKTQYLTLLSLALVNNAKVPQISCRRKPSQLWYKLEIIKPVSLQLLGRSSPRPYKSWRLWLWTMGPRCQLLAWAHGTMGHERKSWVLWGIHGPPLQGAANPFILKYLQVLSGKWIQAHWLRQGLLEWERSRTGIAGRHRQWDSPKRRSLHCRKSEFDILFTFRSKE